MKHPMRKLSVAFSLSLMLVLVITSIVAAIPLGYRDPFSVGPAADTMKIIGSDTTKKLITNTTSTAILGGERDIIFEMTQWDTGDLTKGTSLYVSDGLLHINSDDAVKFKADLQWDGTSDGSGDSKGDLVMGLSGTDRDLTWDGTTSGSYNRFVFGMPGSDISGYVSIIVYEDATHCRQKTFTVSGDVVADNQAIYEATFASFTSGALTSPKFCDNDMNLAKRDFKDVGAVVMQIVSNNPAWDLGLEFLATGKNYYRDYGDLPYDAGIYRYDTYRDGTDTSIYYAQHIDTGLTLGSDMSTEGAVKRNDTDANSDDDNGVTPTGTWASNTTNGGHVSVKVSNCPNTYCYLSAFVDWDASGNFWTIGTPGHYDTGERVLTNKQVSNSTSGQTVNFDIPDISLGGASFFVRFRLTDSEVPLYDGGASPWGVYYSGEVEDYMWTFGPNAVTLAKVEATSPLSSTLPLAALLFPAGIGLFMLVQRRRM